MIVFAIVFGEAYIESFFDTALPSLLTPKNVPALVDRGVEVSLVFFTTESSVPIIAERAQNPVPGMEFFSNVDVSYLEDKDRSDYADKGQWQNDVLRDLMMKAVAYCVKEDRPFIFANADVLYSNGIVENCYRLHRATSKVVGAFNGRVDPGEQTGAFHRLREASDDGYKKAFLKYRSPLWEPGGLDAPVDHARLEHGIQLGEVTGPGKRHREGPSGKAHHPLDLALVVPFARTAITVFEHIRAPLKIPTFGRRFYRIAVTML
jgi:hypothetical protein